jgi:hypothetical protein
MAVPYTHWCRDFALPLPGLEQRRPPVFQAGDVVVCTTEISGSAAFARSPLNPPRYTIDAPAVRALDPTFLHHFCERAFANAAGQRNTATDGFESEALPDGRKVWWSCRHYCPTLMVRTASPTLRRSRRDRGATDRDRVAAEEHGFSFPPPGLHS